MVHGEADVDDSDCEDREDRFDEDLTEQERKAPRVWGVLVVVACSVL